MKLYGTLYLLYNTPDTCDTLKVLATLLWQGVQNAVLHENRVSNS